MHIHPISIPIISREIPQNRYPLFRMALKKFPVNELQEKPAKLYELPKDAVNSRAIKLL